MIDKEIQKLLSEKASQIELDINELKKQILIKVGNLPNHTWSYMQAAERALQKIIYIHSKGHLHSANPLAFATRTNGYRGVYKVYTYPDIPQSYKMPLKLHEYGHIIFQHLVAQEQVREIIENKVATYWTTIKSKVDFSKAQKTCTDANELKHNWIKKFTSMFLNIAMDYEVNSKLYTEEEWSLMMNYSFEAYCIATAKESTIQEDLANIYVTLSETDTELKEKFRSIIFQPCWPADKGFPLKLSYSEYLDLILDNLEDFLDDSSSNGTSDEDSDGKSDDSSSGSGSKEKAKLTTEDIEEIISKYNDCDNEENAENLKESEAQGYSPIGKISKPYSLTVSSYKSLENFLLTNCITKSKPLSKNDIMYYSNRKKYTGNVLISKQRQEERYRPGNVYLLVDVSGSVPEIAVSKVVSVVKKIAKKMGKKSRIILWSTDLEGDYPLSDNIKIQGTGGTWIAKGINYIHTKYLKNVEDRLIIISDYYDSLTHWYNELKSIPNECVGVCWSENMSRTKTYLDSANLNDSAIMSKLLNKLKTTILPI